MQTTDQPADTKLFAKTFIKAWQTQISRIDEFLGRVKDETLMKEVAPGKNRGIYLIGHLTAVHDAMLPILGFGPKLYPQLEKPFITTADSETAEFPTISELKEYWSNVNKHLIQHFNQLEPAEWLTKHTLVSAEDFAKEPHRNKLNVLLTRITHLSYHHGQLIFLEEKI